VLAGYVAVAPLLSAREKGPAIRLNGCVVGQGRDERTDGCICECTELVICTVLNRMLDEHIGWLEAERFGLALCRGDELSGRHCDCGQTAIFNFRDIMRTARSARTSVG